MQLSKFIELTGIVHCETGLRIGGTKEGIADPGGAENTVIRHPITALPYIPGSSLKGKMRSLLELNSSFSGANVSSGKPCGCSVCNVCKIFGSHGLTGKEITRILVRDCSLTMESEKLLREAQEEKGLNFAEIKSENIIDRNKGIAAHGGLRTQERVPSGTEFKMNISLKVFKDDDKVKMVEFVKKGLELLEKDYLGSSGSRGYGKIKIKDLKIEEFDV